MYKNDLRLNFLLNFDFAQCSDIKEDGLWLKNYPKLGSKPQ